MGDELSGRASKFLDSCIRTSTWEGSIRREMIAVDPLLTEAGDDIEEAVLRMVFFDERFGGRTMRVSGGVLAGSLALGLGVGPSIRRSDGGDLMFRMAFHDSAQCAIVMSASGRIGCSWSTEFHPLFDSFEHLVEDCAAWWNIRGWRYVAVSDFNPTDMVATIGGMSPDADASGDMSQWWTSSEIAVAVHPYLNPAMPSKQVAILAADERQSVRVRQVLEAEGFGDRGSTAASLRGIVK